MPERGQHPRPRAAGVLVEQPGARGQRPLQRGAPAERGRDELGQVQPPQTIQLAATVAQPGEFRHADLRPSGSPVRPANSARTSAGKAAACSAPRGSNHAMRGRPRRRAGRRPSPVSAMPAMAMASIGAPWPPELAVRCRAVRPRRPAARRAVRCTARAGPPGGRHLLADDLGAGLVGDEHLQAGAAQVHARDQASPRRCPPRFPCHRCHDTGIHGMCGHRPSPVKGAIRVVAVAGVAGSGKSTLGRALAGRLHRRCSTSMR